MSYIYGVSSKFSFGGWDHELYIFSDPVQAEKWLSTEEYDFRVRELCTRKRASQIVGRYRVDRAYSNAKKYGMVNGRVMYD